MNFPDSFFLQVYLSFLYVGHTHEDIDAKFSKIADKLRQHHAETLPLLMNLVENCEEIHHVHDVKSWFEKNIVDVKQHTKPLHYKFSNSNGEVSVCYKSANGKPWQQLHGGSLFKEEPTTTAIPDLCPPNLKDNNNPERLIQSSKHWKTMLNEEHMEWWAGFLQQKKNLMLSSDQEDRPSSTSSTPWLLPTLPQQTEAREAEDDENNPIIPQAVQHLLDKETEDSEVS